VQFACNSYGNYGLFFDGLNRVFGNLLGREKIWGYFGGSTTKIPPYLLLTPAFPRESLNKKMDIPISRVKYVR